MNFLDFLSAIPNIALAAFLTKDALDMRSKLKEKIIDLIRKKQLEEKIRDEKAPPTDLLPLRSTQTRPLKCLGIEEFLIFAR